jgi:hypothetical protein
MNIVALGTAGRKPLRALAAPANPTVAPIQHALVLGPRTRVVRNLLEVAHLRVELQDMLGAALSRARKQRDRPLVILLEAIASASRDLADEVDSAGQALGQIDALWASDGGSGP